MQHKGNGMAEYDLIVRGGTVVTETDQFQADIGIRAGRIAALAEHLDGGPAMDAAGLLVLPGGVDSHCHIEQLQAGGGADEETFVTGSTAALAGGTTSVITFSTQFKGAGVLGPLAEYRRRAGAGAMVDYAFHQIITDPTDAVVHEELPQVVAGGVRSLKVFLTYDPLRLDDRQYLAVLSAARRLGCLVTVHCENYDAIAWRSAALLRDGRTAPKYHAWSRPAIVEREATHRAIALAELVDTPIEVFHVSCPEAAEEIDRAKRRGVRVWGETCPQYLVLAATDMDRQGFEGAKFMCSPAPRDAAATAGIWDAIRRRTLDVISSDHSGWSYGGPRGKRSAGDGAPFTDIPGTTRILAATILGSSLAFIDGSVLNVALPAIRSSYAADAVEVQWVVNAFTLPLAALLLLGGALGGRDTLRVSGTLDSPTAGVAQFRVRELQLKGISIPSALIPTIVRLLRDRSGSLAAGRTVRVDSLPANALLVKLPPYVADVRVHNNRITLYRATP